jgi:hypothetical protein
MQAKTFRVVKHAAATVLSALVLVLAGGASYAQQQINLTAGPATLALPDGSVVPMWGYGCGAVVSGSTAACAKLNPLATGWSPVVITVPTGQDLTINLTNNLSFGAAPNKVSTSLVIVGQLGGGLGDVTQRTTTAPPDHTNAQPLTWPIAGTAPGVAPTGVGTPPVQGPRVQSFATEVAAGTTTALTWKAPRPGTYLIESGTHPSIQGPMGLYGILVVTSAPTPAAPAGTAYSGVSYNAELPLLLSEIDPVQNNAVQTAVNTAGFSETAVWSGQPGGCGNPTSATFNTCYPPAVNYTPLYYLFNGVAFDKTHATTSLFAASPAAGVTGNVLVRFVNAGLRMHVPSIIGAQTKTPAVAGFALIAEDGNPLPGIPRVQSEVFLAAGKTIDVMINVPAASGTALPVFDRQLSLSANATARDAGMLAYLGINGAGVPAASSIGAAIARPDTYNAVIAGQTLSVSDLGLGVIANDTNVFGVQVLTPPTQGTLTLNANGTFDYVASTTWSGSDSFTYCANGTVTGTTCSSGVSTTVTLGAAPIEAASGITCAVPTPTYSSTMATTLTINPPGILSFCKDAAGYPLTVNAASLTSTGFTSLSVDPNGGFSATVPSAGTYSFSFNAQNSQGTVGATAATVTLNFPAANGPKVTVLDGADKKTTISDYRWIIEEDRTFYVDPKCTTNPLPAGCPTVTPQGAPAVFGTNFHTSYMPVVATGCTGPLSCEGGQTQQNVPVVCDQGNGVCRPDPTGNGKAPVDPSQVYLDPSKRYYISVLPGDAANPFIGGNLSAPTNCAAGAYNPDGSLNTSCGHGMGGAPLDKGQTSVTILTQPSPYPPATLSVFVFEDDYPLNGEHDAGGGIDVLSPNEPGLGGFQITLFDDAGGTGDATGQPTYDMFNMPLTNSLAGSIDPVTGLDACPISPQVTANARTAAAGDCSANPNAKGCQKGIVGMIVTCPKYESDGKTLSPMAGQAVVKNLYAGRYGVVAMPGADRIARGEEWLQTNTLDGQKAHDSFMRIGEPGYFQEFGPAGYHVTIGFANPKIINDRKAGLCPAGTPCTNEVKGHVTTARMSRTPDERLYGSGSRDSFAFTQCFASLGDPDGEEFAFVKCDEQGNFDLTGIPAGNWKLTIFDQWNDQIVDGISTPVGLAGVNGTILDMGEIAAHQWQANINTRTFLDQAGEGVSTGAKPGLPLVATNIRFRDGSFSNFNNTDLNGYAGFNEVFPLFSWYVIETDSTRYKTTGVHVVYDAGGPTDGTCTTSTAPCGSSSIGQNIANTYEANPLPANLSVPGAVYCAEGADCSSSASSFALGTPIPSAPTNHSTGRIDPPTPFGSYGWQGFAGQNSFLEFGKKPFVPGENGGIRGHVVYASTRPFDDPQLLLQTSWEPLIPHVKLNLYKEGVAADGVTKTLTLVDHTETSSFDDWAQGFRSDGVPNMNCPGQSTTDPFYFGLQNQPNYLDWYNAQHGGPAVTALPNNSQFKCYDGMHNWNQLQPAPYDGMYSFPSATGLDPKTGKPTGTNCTACTKNPDSTDPYRYNTPMLPAGKYVVEVVVPPGYELVKEEDKNILIGDNFIAPVVQQFVGLGNIFIMPDQASVNAAYNQNNAQNPTNSLGRVSNLPSHEGDTGSVESFWPCVGEKRVVPDYISLFPGSAEVAPFAGATRPLCDRKEVALDDQTSALAKFYLFTPTHVAAHFTGVITDDFTGEFDPFSPQFGEKFAPAYLPVSIKDWAGNEVSRVYSDQWGAYNGLNYSTWEVNPPNPTGYGPTMMVTCMNDAGTGATPDALYQPGYSQFCYELPFMPGQTGYFDTPVVPTSAFSEGYNHPDCAYPDATPAIKSVVGSDSVAGPWVSDSGTGHTLTITALGDVPVDSYAYSGPSVTTSPFNQQKVTRHYGFGATAGTVALVGSDGVAHNLTGVSWSDQTITGTVPGGVPQCAVQQQQQYGGPASGQAARCGELVITAANGKQSIDTVTVTIGGKTPTVLAAGQTIQSAIDAANPGDMIVVPSGVYNELLQMWKPIRLQGVGAAATIIDANTHPAGKLLDAWRRRLGCLFGLTPDGRPNAQDSSCSNGWNQAGTNGKLGGPYFPGMIVDRLPFEALLGWDTTINGNLAEQLIEPSLMGAYEGAAITVLGKGVKLQQNDPDPFGSAAGSAYTAGTTLLSAGDCSDRRTGKNPYPGNFYCNPSSIDGFGVRNSSQGGGGIFVHAFAHSIQIANNRVHNNTGTLTGGITIGQGEHADVALAGAIPTSYPGSCENSNVTNLALPFCYDMRVNVHHNAVTLNSSMGDELFSSTPAGAGGVSFCTGSDYYNFNHNWVCGNMSTGDGGGLAHIGFIKNGTIEHNQILFNQSTNPTITTNGGGVLVMGAPDADPPCAATNDKDCLSAPNTISPSDGTGPGLAINANLIMGNSADSGSGGGLRLQHVNGTDVINFPNGSACDASLSNSRCHWNTVSVTNNIIANNVAGWDGAGVSLQDALAVNIVNNTIVSNDSTAASGALFNSLFAPLASTPGTNCTVNNGSQSCPQVAGLVSVTNSPVLVANLPTSGFSCPVGHGSSGSGNGQRSDICKNYSVPLLYNDVIWQNRSYFIGVGDFGTGNNNQQKVVTLYNSFSTTPAPSQPQTDATAANGGGVIVTGGTGACTTASYWDIGVRGDSGPGNHVAVNGVTLRLAPTYSVLTDAADYPGANNTGANPTVLSQYCNGSRVPPELGSMGYMVNPGTNETNALPTPVFSLTPSATVDEGNNWVNMRWGPLALANPVSGTTLGDYGPAAGSPAINYIPAFSPTYGPAPSTDFYGNPRKNGFVDAGAVEFVGAANTAVASLTGGPLAFGTVATGSTSAAQTLTLHNTGTANLTGITLAFSSPRFSRPAGAAGGTCGAVLTPAAGTCTINVVFSPNAAGAVNGTLTLTANVAVTGSPVGLSGTGFVPGTLSYTSATNATLSTVFGTRVLNFGTIAAPRNAVTSVVTVRNTGAGPLTITAETINNTVGANFSSPGNTCVAASPLAPNATCTVSITYTPPAAAPLLPRFGTSTLANNGTSNGVLTLSGR